MKKSPKRERATRKIVRKSARLSVSLPPELRQEVEAAAVAENRTIANYVRQVLRDALLGPRQ
jgi:predicted DNA-binding protein